MCLWTFNLLYNVCVNSVTFVLFSKKDFIGAHITVGEWEQITSSLACSLVELGVSLFLIWVEGKGVQGSGRVRAGGVAQCSAHHSGSVECRGMLSTLLLLQALQKRQLGFLVSLYLLSKIWSKCTCMQLFLVPYSFFVFCARGEVCPGRSIAALQRRIPGHSLSHSSHETLHPYS